MPVRLAGLTQVCHDRLGRENSAFGILFGRPPGYPDVRSQLST